MTVKTYNIYNMYTDEKIGEVTSTSIIAAELLACKIFNTGSEEVYALTKED